MANRWPADHWTQESRDRFFWRKVRINQRTGCWEWTGGISKQTGYGQIRPAPGRSQGAHRWAYERFVGPVNPPELVIDHLCRNRRCVNPTHLEPVTRLENFARGIRRNQYDGTTHCKAGHEYTPENAAYRPSGIRRCRACARRWKKESAKRCGR